MSDFQFGVTHRRVTQKEASRLNTICRKEGGFGFIGPVDLPGNPVKGWMRGPNKGLPFDGDLARRVLAAVEAEGIEL